MSLLFDYVKSLRAAQAKVAGSPLWMRFIDGTPLANDVAVWMADHAASAVKPFQEALGQVDARARTAEANIEHMMRERDQANTRWSAAQAEIDRLTTAVKALEEERSET